MLKIIDVTITNTYLPNYLLLLSHIINYKLNLQLIDYV